MTLDVSVSGTGPLTYAWRDSAEPIPIGSSPSLAVSNLRQTTSYTVEISNACGSITSSVATITVEGPRRRASRH